MTAALHPHFSAHSLGIRLLAAPDESEKIAQSTGPMAFAPSRRRITACDQRFEGYPSMLACYIRRAAGTHEYLYYDSSGQRRAGPQLTGLGTSCALYFSSPPNAIFPGMRRKKERHTAGAPAETMSHGGTAKEVTLCFFSPHPLLCYLFPAHPRALPYPMGTSSDPASLPYYLAAFCITNYSKTALAKRPIPQSGVSGSGYVMRGRKGG